MEFGNPEILLRLTGGFQNQKMLPEVVAEKEEAGMDIPWGANLMVFLTGAVSYGGLVDGERKPSPGL